VGHDFEKVENPCTTVINVNCSNNLNLGMTLDLAYSKLRTNMPTSCAAKRSNHKTDLHLGYIHRRLVE